MTAFPLFAHLSCLGWHSVPRISTMNTTPTSVKEPWHTTWKKAIAKWRKQGADFGSTRTFTPEEMARAGDQQLPAGIDQFFIANSFVGLILLPSFIGEWVLFPWFALMLVLLTIAQLWAIRQVWQLPQGYLCVGLSYGISISGLIVMLIGDFVFRPLISAQYGEWPEIGFAIMVVYLLSILHMLAIFRVQQIEARLRELEEHDAQLKLTHRLATAQIHPHFVFNTLASLTHWVETQDPRAAPLLHDFNAYLRATLPMFERDSQPFQEELDLVRRYLAIMQARLGDRLNWSVNVDATLSDLLLPPGSLLTLVENAITHGIEPAIRGGNVRVSAMRKGDQACIEVVDTGVGLDGTAVDGLGLTNTRQRLVTLHPRAGLSLHSRGESGCTAMIEIPV